MNSERNPIFSPFSSTSTSWELQSDDENGGGAAAAATASSSGFEFLLDIPTLPCKCVGYAIYYLGISMFHWMSVMCFDLCWTFARSR